MSSESVVGAVTPDGPAPITCPRCGGENPADAVFCANPQCHKALGEMPFVLEELAMEARWHELLAERAAGFVGRPQFLLVHAAWFGLWIAINLGFLAFIRRFDEYPFGLLGTLLGIEAIFITGFLLINDRRQSVHEEKRAQLDYEVSVRNHRELHHLGEEVQRLREQLDRLEAAVERLAAPRDPE